jgi:gamma-glutamyltranspeptidase/glutathione hydrolase
MSFLGIGRRRIFAGLMLLVTCGLPASGQERRGFYTPAASDSIHAVVARHGMVVAQE